MVGEIDIIKAWDELNKINNDIELLKTLLTTRTDIPTSKLKEILVQCSFSSNDSFINIISSNDKDIISLRSKYVAKRAYENYISKELERLKLSEPAICIAFLKEYKREPMEKISRKLNMSLRSCYRYYDEYVSKKKGTTPLDNSYIEEKIAKK